MQTHGINIGLTRQNSTYFLNMQIVGKLTHEDYQATIPLLESFIKDASDKKVNLFVDITLLEGWELKAAWDDLKFGLKHSRDFGKIAVLGCNNMQEWMTKIGNWFTFAKIEYFEEKDEALKWLERQ